MSEEPFAAFHATVRFQRYPTEQSQYLLSLAPPYIKPGRICNQTGQHRHADSLNGVQRRRQCSRCQQPRHGRQWKTSLFQQDDTEQHRATVLNKKLRRLIHVRAATARSVPRFFAAQKHAAMLLTPSEIWRLRRLEKPLADWRRFLGITFESLQKQRFVVALSL